MPPVFTTIEIKGFRTLQELALRDLGRVNLVTGMNNTGKSSVLEAIRLLASGGSVAALHDILTNREEVSERSRGEPTTPLEPEGSFIFSSLFSGFPSLSKATQPIALRANGGLRSFELGLEIGWFSERRSEDGLPQLVELPDHGLFGADAGIPALKITSPDGQRRIRLQDDFLRFAYRRATDTEQRLRCAYVSPYSGRSTESLGELWDEIALSDRERHVIAALQIIAPEVIDVSFVGDSKRLGRKAMVRSTGFPRPVPLRSFGDGLNRLFAIILSLVNAQDGLLLIDEFENGLHYTIQADAWRLIFRVAAGLNVQVFATTHSGDTIRAFERAASEAKATDARLVRLTRKEDTIIPRVYPQERLAIAVRDEIEVR